MAFFVKSAYAASSFSDSFDDQSKISQTARVSLDTTNSQVTLQPAANSLTDNETLLLTHLGSDSDITTPAIAGGGGGTPFGIIYTFGNGGYNGEAAIIIGNANITFPVSGNFNPRKGTIDFWLSFYNWGLDCYGHTPDYPNEETILYAADGSRSIWVYRDWRGRVMLDFFDPTGGVYSWDINAYNFAPWSWHHFTFTWNIEEDCFYIASWLDGTYVKELADPSPNTFDVASFCNSFNPTTFYIGNKPGSQKSLNGIIDELRITNTEYSATSYPGKAGILTSTAFDTGVTNPVWGNIKWDETLPSKTDIELQTSTSDDGVTWTNWFSTDNGMITITFDDGYTGVYNNAYPVMNAFGFKGVPYIITGNVGWPGYMTLSQLQQLHNAGWETGSHNSIHVAFYTQQNLSNSKNWLMNNGLDCNAFAYVGGDFNQSSINSVSDYFTTAKTIINQYQTYNTKYRLYAYAGDSGVFDVDSWIDSVVNKKAWGILTFHSVNEPGTPGYVSTSDFTSIMQHISDSGLDVLTMKDALAGLAMYTNSTGSQILSANKRYIRYRAVLHSYNGTSSPTLSSVTISAPAKIYKNIATTITADGNYDHAVWPQTTDTPIDNLTVTPDSGSVTINVDTWNTSGSYYKKWTETASASGITVEHTVGDLQANYYYVVMVNGNTLGSYLSDSSGQITFSCNEDYSAKTFEIGEYERIYFAGYGWWVKRYLDPVDPGPNYFSDSNQNVWVDSNGCLHLKIVQIDGKWYCSEIIADISTGYGTYAFTLQDRTDLLDENIVLGLSTEENTLSQYPKIDINFSRWGNANATNNAQFVVPPWDITANTFLFNVDLAAQQNETTTHTFTWNWNYICFQSYYGDFLKFPTAENLIAYWSYTGNDIPSSAEENPHISFWLVNGNVPANGQDAEIVIKDFKYLPDAATEIDFSYFILFATHWLETDCGSCNGADLSGDGNVDFTDFALFASHWLETNCGSCNLSLW